MRFTKGFACVATLVVSLAADVGLAAVTSPTVIWFSDNFDSYASGTRLRLVSPANWNGSAGTLGAPVGPENMVLNTFNYPSGAGNSVRLKGNSGSGASSLELNTTSFAASSVGKLAILDFKIKAEDAGNPFTSDHGAVYMMTAAGTAIAGWTGGEFRMKSKYTYPAGTEGNSTNLTDTNWHDFAITYDPTTGDTNWYADGVLNMNQSRPTGQNVAYVFVADNVQSGAADNHIWLDNIAIGTTPEPGALLLLGTGLVGMFAAPRRRAR